MCFHRYLNNAADVVNTRVHINPSCIYAAYAFDKNRLVLKHCNT